jgi:hypothetical protein
LVHKISRVPVLNKLLKLQPKKKVPPMFIVKCCYCCSKNAAQCAAAMDALASSSSLGDALQVMFGVVLKVLLKMPQLCPLKSIAAPQANLLVQILPFSCFLVK